MNSLYECKFFENRLGCGVKLLADVFLEKQEPDK